MIGFYFGVVVVMMALLGPAIGYVETGVLIVAGAILYTFFFGGSVLRPYRRFTRR